MNSQNRFTQWIQKAARRFLASFREEIQDNDRVGSNDENRPRWTALPALFPCSLSMLPIELLLYPFQGVYNPKDDIYSLRLEAIILNELRRKIVLAHSCNVHKHDTHGVCNSRDVVSSLCSNAIRIDEHIKSGAPKRYCFTCENFDGKPDNWCIHHRLTLPTNNDKGPAMCNFLFYETLDFLKQANEKLNQLRLLLETIQSLDFISHNANIFHIVDVWKKCENRKTYIQ